MAGFGIKLDPGGVDVGLREMIGDDLPFTIARFLTLSAQDGQEAGRQLAGRVFKLRNDWTTRNVRITPATKTKLMSEVFTDTSNRRSGAPDYLPAQDEGGEKVPLGGHRYLAVPTRYLRKLAPGVIPSALRPRSLLPPNANLGQAYQGKFGRVGKAATPYPRTSHQDAILSNGDFVAFAQTTKSGVLCIFVRHGGVGFHGGSQDAEPFYTLIRAAHIQPRFPLEQVVEAIVQQNADRNFDRAAAEVLVNRALKSGLQVKF
jgi:hypothetical protein